MALTLSESYLIWSNEHAAWWRPNASGYTAYIEDAGRYSREKAIAHSRVRDQHRGMPLPEMPIKEIDALAITTHDSQRYDNAKGDPIGRYAVELVQTANRRNRCVIGSHQGHLLRAIPKVTDEDDVIRQLEANLRARKNGL